MKLRVLSLVILVASFGSLAGEKGRLLAQDSETVKFYSKNQLKCPAEFLSNFLKRGQAKKAEEPDTPKTKELCTSVINSCCSAAELDLMVSMFNKSKEEMKPHLKQITYFLEYISTTDTEKFVEKYPIKEDLKAEASNLLKESIKALRNDVKLTISKIESYFNTALMNYSGLICQACDNRFGSFFSPSNTLTASPDMCTSLFENESSFAPLSSNLMLLLPLANLLSPPTDPAYKVENFEKSIQAKTNLISKCKANEDSGDVLTDEDLDKEVQEAEKATTDIGVSGAVPKSDDERPRLKKPCETLCISLLPSASFRLPFDFYGVINYVHNALIKEYPSATYPPMNVIPAANIEFYPDVKKLLPTSIIYLEPTAINFRSFPLPKSYFELAKVEEIKETTLTKSEIFIPMKEGELSIWKKIYNVLFGWIFGRYT